MIHAAEQLVSGGMTDLGLLFVVGEEAGSAGALAANTIPNHCRYLINGEPTQSKLALGSKGALRFALKVNGRAAHSAYPEMGESAVDKLLDLLADLRKVELPVDPTLGATTLNIGLIKGGVATNVIAPAAEAEGLFRVVSTAQKVKDLLEKTVGGRARLEYSFECDAVFMEALDGFETDVVRFTTDIPLLGNWGRPLLFGPGSILDAHTEHERILKSELLRAVDIYQRMIANLKEKILSE
jgi:acetylornithine deacetylase